MDSFYLICFTVGLVLSLAFSRLEASAIFTSAAFAWAHDAAKLRTAGDIGGMGDLR